MRVEWTLKQSVVYFFIHHACCDGISAIRFITEVLARYARRVDGGGDTPDLPAIRPALLTRRTKVELADGRRPAWIQFVTEITRILTRGSANVRRSTVRVANEPGRAIVTRTLPRSAVRDLRQVAARLGVTVNDICASEFGCVLADWNKSAGTSGPIRFILPLSLRSPEHDLMPAANCISYLPIEFSISEARDNDSLARKFHQRTAAALECNFGLVFLKALRWGRRLPGVLPWFVSSRRRLCTAVFANVGDVRRSILTRFPQSQGRLIAGNIRVDRIDGVAPIRPHTALAVSIGTYAGELVLNMRADPETLSQRDADALFDALLSRLKRRCQKSNQTKAAA